MTIHASAPPKHTATLGVLIFWQLFLISTSFASFYLRSFTDSLLLYLPIAFSIILIHWYGWRMLLIIYVNAIVTLFIWRAPGPWWKLVLIATHGPVIAIVSKLLVDRLMKRHYTTFFDTTNSFVLFVFYGIIIPCSVNSLYVYHYSFINGNLEKVLLVWLADFLTILTIAIPILYFFKPANKTVIAQLRSIPLFTVSTFKNKNRSLVEFVVALVVFIMLSFEVPFDKYWFVYGIGAIIVAVRLGFEWVILINVAIFVLNYVLPLINIFSSILILGSTQLTNIHLGSATMMLVSLLVGRVVSDLRATEDNLVAQKAEIEKANQQLSRANQELDRFVYSVSHDLSAPLKSIKGLVNISKLDSASSPAPYLEKIEQSVLKLEDFIDEVLDYSRTNRKELIKEKVPLTALFKEVIDKFTYTDNFDRVRFVTNFKVETLHTDKFLLKVIMSNLLSNAIKYQKTIANHEPLIELKSHCFNGYTYLVISDNGEGIKKANQEKIFSMFYRGTANSTGSGLGLYIAREAVQKLGGAINFKSEYGEGSTFTVILQEN